MKQSDFEKLSELPCASFEERLPGRSRLFSLAPIALGTVHREGLISYLIRLAGAHSVNPRRLIRTEFAAAQPEISTLLRADFFQKNGRTINGPSAYAGLFCQATEDLTGLNQLRYMTLLPLKHLLPGNGAGLLAREVWWCPGCFAERAAARQVTYRPLLWSFRHYRFCSIHACSLVNRCPKCGSLQPVIPAYPSASHCCQCGTCLGAAISLGDKPTDDDLWISSAIEDVVANLSTIEKNSSMSLFLSMINMAVHLTTSGNRQRFCLEIGLKPWAIEEWVSGHRPSFPQWLALAYGLGIAPSQLFADKHGDRSREQEGFRRIPNSLKLGGHKPPISETERKLLEHKLEAIATDPNNHRSLSDVAKALSYPLLNLRNISPVFCQRIQEKYRQAVKSRSEQRLKNEKEEIQAIIRALIKNGEYPGGGKVNKRLRQRGIALVRPELKKTYRDEIDQWKNANSLTDSRSQPNDT